MGVKITRKCDYVPEPGIVVPGVSATVPRLSLSVSELVKRFTLTTLKEMEAKSLLTYDFGPEITEDPFSLLDKLDLSASSCIDITDVAQLRELAMQQIEEYHKNYNKEKEARSAAAKAKEDAAKDAQYKEFLARAKSDGFKIE